MKQSYKENIEMVLKTCQTSVNGLTSIEVKERQQNYGRNEIKSKPKVTIFDLILEQFKDKMTLILMIASLFSFFLGEVAEGVVILIIIIINALVSIIEEKKAADAIEALKKMSAPQAFVLRDGIKQIVLVTELVVGDIVFLEDGGFVPADIRLLKENMLTIDESTLTGESVEVKKNATLIFAKEIPLGDQINMAFASTIVTYGTAVGVVVSIGNDTEVGKIARMLDNEDEMESLLKQKLNHVGKILSIAGILISVVIFIIGLCYGRDITMLLMISISLAISVVPEGLPATASIVMALGVQRMASKNALVKKLPAVETLGSASIICTDKTGTLTQNKMTVTKIMLGEDFITKNDSRINNEITKDFMNGCILCNNATITNGKTTGDPTEIALLLFAIDKKQDVNKIKKESPKLYEKPFDSDRKRMSSIHNMNGEYICFVKGAVEELLALCTHIIIANKTVKLTKDMKNQIFSFTSHMSSEALRLLGIAKKEMASIPSNKEENIENNLTFLGVVGMIDPPRKEVLKAIQTCRTAGIKVIMITGDHKLTAISIAKQLGIYKEGDSSYTGEELKKLTPEELKKEVKNVSVFARVTPEDKLNIVNALKANKEVVAMTGDGVNDAPALKAADIGIAMGNIGTDVAKSAADMILLDDNFTTIEIAIREGRRVYRNIQKVIQFLLAGNIAEVLTIFIAMIFNWATPILAVHILFVNLVTDTLPAIALGVDPENKNSMKSKPIKTGSLFEKTLVTRVILYGTYIAFISLIAYHVGLNRNYSAAITMTFLVISLSQIVHALNQHSNTMSIFHKKHPKNKKLYLAMLASTLLIAIIIIFPPFANFFSIVQLQANEWQIVLLLSISPLLIVEFFKLIHRNTTNKNK